MKISNFDSFRKGELDGKLMTKVILLFFVLVPLGVVNASAVECPPGFRWEPWSGAGCVQIDCFKIEHAKYSDTQRCICEDGYKPCHELVDYTGFDKSKCNPNCPRVKLIACVKPDEPCPGEKTPPKKNCRDYCEEKFDQKKPVYLRLFDAKGEYPFCYCICMDEQTGDEVLCWEESWDCEEYCSKGYKNEQWDGTSEWPYCECICKKGYEGREEGCVPCEVICREKGGEHYIEDNAKSEPNSCACTCEDGYEYDYSSKKCEIVDCPPNSTNVAKLGGACPQDRKLNRYCCCDKGYIRYESVCVKEESGEEDYFVEPVVEEIIVGRKIIFSLVKKKLGRYTTVSNDKIDWVVVNQQSISEYIDIRRANINIGDIDDTTGVFTGLNIGTCTVIAKIDGNIKAKTEVTVRCPDGKGDLKKILSLYKRRIPEGPFHEDLRKGKLSLVFRKMNPGHATNLLAITDPRYEKFTCGGCQGDALKFLHGIQADPKNCTLLNGYEFGPIQGSSGAHHAVVIFPKGTDWKKTGIVLDAWPHQKPEHFNIDVWRKEYSNIAGDTMHHYRGRYPTTKDPSDFDFTSFQVWTVVNDLLNGITGVAECPIDLLITDNEGRRLGMLRDGSMTFEIPDGFITKLPDGEGGNSWFFALNPDTAAPYTLEMTGTDEGTFELFTVNPGDTSIKYYGFQSIAEGAKAEIVLDPNNPTAPLTLPDGTEVQPTVLEPPTEVPGLTFESRSKSSGSIVQIPLTLRGLKEKIGNMDITLSYDPSVLDAKEVIKGSLTTKALFDYNILDGTIKISLADEEGFSGDGSIAHVKFNVIGAEGSSSPLTIVAIAANKAEDYETLEVPTNDGVFRVISMEESRGDGDGDGGFTALDALYALQMAVGKIPEDLAMDMNGDGSRNENRR